LVRAAFDANRGRPFGEWRQDWAKGRAVIEWSCSLLRSGTDVNEAQRLWFVASVALARDARDVLFLAGIPANVPEERRNELLKQYGPAADHLGHAAQRFPSDQRRWRLLASELTWKAAAVDALQRRQETPRSEIAKLQQKAEALRARAGLPNRVSGPSRLASDDEVGRLPVLLSLQAGERELRSMVQADDIAAEIELDLGILALNFGERQAAEEHLASALRSSGDPYTRYLSALLRGRVEEAAGHGDEAAADYQTALTTVPGAWSAATSLSALLFVRGDVTKAVALARRATGSDDGIEDPWLILLDRRGPPFWQKAITELRAALFTRKNPTP
jgi:tetratricopeptide (TPR) repeat protein